MSNLIITILGIALAAIITILGITYLSDNFSANNAQMRASLLKEQAQQYWQLTNQYMLDNGLSSFNDVTPGNLFTSKMMPTVIPMVTLPAISSSGSANTAQWYHTCGRQLDGYDVNFHRYSCRMYGRDVIVYRFYQFSSGSCWSLTGDLRLASSATHPVVQMCLKVNAKAELPPGLTYTASGLPLQSTSGTISCSGGQTVEDPGQARLNYCYITSGSPQAVMYVFGG